MRQNFAHEMGVGSVSSFQLSKGSNRFCLAQAGIYHLTPDRCHQLEQGDYTFDTSVAALSVSVDTLVHLPQCTGRCPDHVLCLLALRFAAGLSNFGLSGLHQSCLCGFLFVWNYSLFQLYWKKEIIFVGYCHCDFFALCIGSYVDVSYFVILCRTSD